MIATNFDDADGTLLSSAAAGGEGGLDADRGFPPFAATAPSYHATAAVGEGGMAMATTYYDNNAGGAACGGIVAGGGGGVDTDRGFTPFAAAARSFDVTAAVGEGGMAVATTYDDDDVGGAVAGGSIVALGGGASSSSSDDPFGVGGGYGIGIVVAPSPPRMGMQPPMMQSQARQSSRQMQTTAYGQPQQQQGQVQPLDPFEGVRRLRRRRGPGRSSSPRPPSAVAVVDGPVRHRVHPPPPPVRDAAVRRSLGIVASDDDAPPPRAPADAIAAVQRHRAVVGRVRQSVRDLRRRGGRGGIRRGRATDVVVVVVLLLLPARSDAAGGDVQRHAAPHDRRARGGNRRRGRSVARDGIRIIGDHDRGRDADVDRRRRYGPGGGRRPLW